MMREGPQESRAQLTVEAGSEWHSQQPVIGSVESLLEPRDLQPQEGGACRWWTLPKLLRTAGG